MRGSVSGKDVRGHRQRPGHVAELSGPRGTSERLQGDKRHAHTRSRGFASRPDRGISVCRPPLGATGATCARARGLGSDSAGLRNPHSLRTHLTCHVHVSCYSVLRVLWWEN